MTDKPNKAFEDRKAKIADFIAKQVTEDTKAVSVIGRNGTKYRAITLDLEKSEINFMESMVAANWRELMANANSPVTHQVPKDITEDEHEKVVKEGDFSKFVPIEQPEAVLPTLQEVAPKTAPPRK
jgi:hypothetical protein